MFSKLLAGSIIALSIRLISAAGVTYAGVNIAGFDFGCSTDGTCPPGSAVPPLGQNGAGDGPGQMNHFAKDDGLNIFRLPVAWQYLVNNQLGGTLDATNFGQYDKLVQACLQTGASCIIDIHNYARWNGQVIGSSGGPTNENFAGLWSQLATKYAAETKVIMGLMNEPHDMPDMTSWAASCQAAVTAIRTAGATSQMILLPGDDFTSCGSMVSTGSAAALAGITNPDGSKVNLVFDVHNYFDSDYSGTSPDCVSNRISDGFQPFVDFLRQNKRQALVSEMGGGGSSPSCITFICQALTFLNQNADVYIGYVAWAAGSFPPSYPLSLIPDGAADKPLMTQCFKGMFQGGAGAGVGGMNATSPAANSGASGGGAGTPPMANAAATVAAAGGPPAVQTGLSAGAGGISNVAAVGNATAGSGGTCTRKAASVGVQTSRRRKVRRNGR